ncbi:hypothetical protein AAFC00_004352 [Neodothiora populina]|uniref:Uncharacterized protein n=1 Tax=Neodothiora populina TaxID=2781224 RepID=A0ABR3PJT1_9PEZI
MSSTDTSRKERTPFRPLNSLHSIKQPDFGKSILSSSTKHQRGIPTENSQRSIGDDSSLFDSTDGSINFDIIPVIPPQYVSPRKDSSSDMAIQREPPKDKNASSSSTSSSQHSASSQRPAADALPNRASLQQTEFGKASPLRNPLRRDHPNVFNPNKGRNEHHRAAPAPAFRDPRSIIAAAPPSQPQFKRPGDKPRAHVSQQSSDPLFAPIRNPLYAPQPNPLRSSTSQHQAIRMPTNNAPKTIHAPPRPTFSSSVGPNTSFQPSGAPPASRKTIDLTSQDSDDDDRFDPNAALREDKFGSADAHAYVDASQTGENIKALLEGAFEDDEDKPKIRLRKRAKKQDKPSTEDKKMQSLEAKLKELELEAETKQEEEKPAEEDEDEEDGTVEGMKVKLLPHQVDGVAWMTDKEIGVRKKNGVLPRGGILADDMGLGKTIQSVTLILTNPRPALDAKPPPENPKQKMPIKDVGKGTLVVAPLALIKQWEAEIKDKVDKDHALRVLVHHGPSRTKSHAELKKYDVVITTYQILASEHAGSSDADGGAKLGCFGVHWYRVILDEAHSIKNRNAKSTKACYALKSWYRWCLTGTPMQNNLDELQSLIAFLKIKPYNNLGNWKEQITGPMKNGQGQIAIKRVQYFLKGFMKRRTKDILKQDGALNFGGNSKTGEQKGAGMRIVKRDVKTIICELDPRERDLYDQLQERAQSRLNDMMAGESNDYMGALVLLLRLRQACNHPQLISGSMAKDGDAVSVGRLIAAPISREGSNNDNDLDDLAGLIGGLTVETKVCDICSAKLTPEEASKGSPRCFDCEQLALNTHSQKKRSKKEKKKQKVKAEAVKKPAPRIRNRKVVLDSDDEDDEGEGDWLVDETQQKRPDLGRAGGTDDEDAEGGGESLGSIDSVDDSGITSTIASDSAVSESDDDSEDEGSSDPSMPLASTKVRRLLKILHTETPEHKTIVFSQFTSMLDIIEPHLKKASIKYVRYDGSMKNDAREAALESLRNHKATRVLLCSLKCGSLGLNLTAASRVVIVEPFWNPFVEEQAIDRVHRLNQTVDVKVFRLTVGNTVEERILELQEKKRELAKAAIEGGTAVGKLSMRDIMSLFGRNAEIPHVDDNDPQGKPVNYSMPKIARNNPDKRREASSSGGAPRQVGWSNGRLSYDRNDRRGGYERNSGGRIRNEDPVYGRR